MNEDKSVVENEMNESDGTIGDIEIGGESFHIEEFEPDAEEYRELVGGIYRSFYEEDMRIAVERAVSEKSEEIRRELEAKMQEKEKSIRDEERREILMKIAQRRLRPDENGLTGKRSVTRKDVSKMTREERAQAARKAAGGLIINFK